ncbi:MAG: hypothetical protein AABN95_20790 [Acidobacteriota bacterium]
MKLPLIAAGRLFTVLLPLVFLTITTHAQESARIKLESLDKLATKATEVVRKEEKPKSGDGVVYVRCFEFREAGDYKETDLQEIRAQLQTPNWSRFMRVDAKDVDPDENETVEIYVFGRRAGSDIFSGMTIIATQPKELAVVNIVGQGNINEITKRTKQAKPRK